ncbi:hypothetical protein [Lysinibacillus zambalensis]
MEEKLLSKNAKQVVQISYYNNRVIKTWDSISSASKGVGVSTTNISLACRGKLRSAGGYQWRYKESLHKLI